MPTMSECVCTQGDTACLCRCEYNRYNNVCLYCGQDATPGLSVRHCPARKKSRRRRRRRRRCPMPNPKAAPSPTVVGTYTLESLEKMRTNNMPIYKAQYTLSKTDMATYTRGDPDCIYLQGITLAGLHRLYKSPIRGKLFNLICTHVFNDTPRSITRTWLLIYEMAFGTQTPTALFDCPVHPKYTKLQRYNVISFLRDMVLNEKEKYPELFSDTHRTTVF